MFTESLTARPELENGQDPNRTLTSNSAHIGAFHSHANGRRGLSRAIARPSFFRPKVMGPKYPRFVSQTGGKAGVDVFRRQRCGWLRRGKGYGSATLVTDPRHATRLKAGDRRHVVQSLHKLCEAVAQPRRFPALRHHGSSLSRSYPKQEERRRGMGDPDAYRHALREPYPSVDRIDVWQALGAWRGVGDADSASHGLDLPHDRITIAH